MGENDGAGKKPLVLIVDDDGLIRASFQDALNGAGFETVTACDGAEAVELFATVRPDLVLLDINMPVMDGCETCRTLRSVPDGSLTPIIMVTGMNDKELIHCAFEAGATDFVTKPVSPDLMVYRVHHILRASRCLGRLAESENRLRMIKAAVDCLTVGITLSDVRGEITYVNPAEAMLHGYGVEELIGREARCYAGKSLAGDVRIDQLVNIGVWCRESVNIRADGTEFPVQLTSIPVRDDNDALLGLVTVCEDISARKEVEKKIHRLAYFDTLTGLPNRRMFMERLQQAVAQTRREGGEIGLLFIDLDNFKEVNDTHGHHTGDLLLREVTGRLNASRREYEILARLGGDEFVVLLAPVDSRESLTVVAERMLSGFSQPFELDGRQVRCSASIGIAMCPDDARDAESLVKCADEAMYHAKNSGRSCCMFFAADMQGQPLNCVPPAVCDGRLPDGNPGCFTGLNGGRNVTERTSVAASNG